MVGLIQSKNGEKMKKLLILGLISIMLTATGCLNTPQPSDSPSQKSGIEKTVNVVVSILPQKEFVEKIGGENVKVSIMIPPGASPHTYEPTPSQMRAVSDADLYVKVGSGIEFENAWMDKITAANPDMSVVDCSQGVHLREMAAHDHHDEGEDHEHEEEEEDHDEIGHLHEEDEHEEHDHHHDSLDPHIWLSVKNAKAMVENIYAGLADADPENAQSYRQNKNTYLQELDELDDELEASLGTLESKKFMVFHPAWGYLAHDYGLTQVPVEQEGKEPSAKELAALIDEAKEENIKVVFASPQFNQDTAQAIAQDIRGAVVLIDPLAEDYATNLQTVATEIQQSIKASRQ